MISGRLRLFIIGICTLFILTLPLTFSPFQLRMATNIIIFTLFAATWRMLWFEIGLLSFGHALYFGVGAYLSVLAWTHIKPIGFLSGVIIGGFASAVLGLLLGIFLVRVSGTYYALLTLAFNQFFWAIAWKWRDVTGGDDGLTGFPKPHLLGLDMNDLSSFYYACLGIVSICSFIYWFLTKTPLWHIINSIKSNPERSTFLGFNPNIYKLVVFGISSLFAGIAGALYAQFHEFIATGVIDVFMSTDVLFMAFIGGVSNFFGPFVGSAIFVYLSEYLSGFTHRWEFIFGLIFVVIVLFAPEGILQISFRKKPVTPAK